MSSSSDRVLRNATVAGRLPLVGGIADAVQVGESTQAAYERGLRDGMAAGRGEAAALLEGIAAGLGQSLDATRAHIADLRRIQAEALIGTALEIAELVVGSAPGIDRSALVERLRQALQGIDDGPLTVYLHPGDREAVGAALSTRFDLELADDPLLTPGEARVAGPWAHADLTREAALAAVREAIG